MHLPTFSFFFPGVFFHPCTSLCSSLLLVQGRGVTFKTVDSQKVEKPLTEIFWGLVSSFPCPDLENILHASHQNFSSSLKLNWNCW